MTNFRKIFEPTDDHTKWPDTVDYKGKKIFPFDRFPVKNHETIKLSIEETNSTFIQGIAIGVFDGYIKVGKIRTNKIKFLDHLFYEDATGYDPKNIDIKIFTKGDHITISNIWEIDVEGEWKMPLTGFDDSFPPLTFKKCDKPKKEPLYYGSPYWPPATINGAAMYSEDIPGGKRYFCNDGDEDDDFNDIIFTVKRAL